MGLTLHTQVDKGYTYSVWKYHICCVLPFSILIICFTVLFSETPDKSTLSSGKGWPLNVFVQVARPCTNWWCKVWNHVIFIIVLQYWSGSYTQTQLSLFFPFWKKLEVIQMLCLNLIHSWTFWFAIDIAHWAWGTSVKGLATHVVTRSNLDQSIDGGILVLWSCVVSRASPTVRRTRRLPRAPASQGHQKCN